MADPIRNERGAAALLYVVLISLILLVATPVILSTVSTDASQGVMNRNTQIAENMAASGLEAFIRYLDKYNGSQDGQRLQYLNQYGGFTNAPVSFANPEGVPITFSFVRSESGSGTNIFTIQSSASAGVEPYKRTKTITYQIDANMPVTTTYVDPDNRETVSSNQKILVQGSYTDGVQATPRPDLKTPIHDAIADYRTNGVPPVPTVPNKSNIDAEVALYESNINQTCSCSKIADIQTAVTNLMNSTTSNPVILKVNGGIDNWESSPVPVTLGTPSRPVVLIFGGDTKFGGNGDVKINVFGNVIVKNGGFHMNGQSNSALTIKKSSTGNYGNLYVYGAIQNSNPAATNAEGTVFGGNIALKGNLKAGNLLTTGSFDADTTASMDVSGGNMIAQSFTTSGTGSTLKAGNLYVSNSFTMNNPSTVTISGTTRAGSLTVKGSGSSFTSGSVYATGELVLTNETSIKATAGDINVDSFSLSTNSSISATNLIVRQALNIYNDSHITLTGDALLGEMHVHTRGVPGIVASSGDILVEGDITAGNNITLVSGGYIATGGNLTINTGTVAGSNIQSGGGTTSLHLSGGGSSGGTSTSPGAWKPKRVG